MGREKGGGGKKRRRERGGKVREKGKGGKGEDIVYKGGVGLLKMEGSKLMHAQEFEHGYIPCVSCVVNPCPVLVIVNDNTCFWSTNRTRTQSSC